MRKIIFHIPNKLDEKIQSGSQIRPPKMIQAFKNIGYDVDVIMGDCADRKKQIKAIEKKIKSGIKYNFLYSESSTMPTALTEKHHLPVAPFLDFLFFKFCKSKGIKIGLFYRDIYWVFKEYRKDTSFFKYHFAKWFYFYDLKAYNRYVDILYLPSTKMQDYLPIAYSHRVAPLPPAVPSVQCDLNQSSNLRFVYLGGISGVYDLTLFAKVLSDIEGTMLSVCTRVHEWEKSRHRYKDLSIDIYHLSGDALCNIYRKSDISVYFLKPGKLWEFAMGVKLFEYMAYGKPMIAVKGTAVGEFIESNDIGWVIDYDEVKLRELITYLQNYPEAIEEKRANIKKIIPSHTWEARATQVAKDLG